VQVDKRKYDRDDAQIPASCRVRGLAYRAWLSEVSQLGCCAETARDVAVPGERVLLQLGRLLVLPAVVRWVAGGRAGLEFANPMQGALLGRYAARRAGRASELPAEAAA
jgi:hypothetical protein